MIRGQHLVGKVLGGYLLEKVLGFGGSSVVYLAQKHNSMSKVAIKVFLPREPLDRQIWQDAYTRFLHEAEIGSSLNHPHILPIYSYGAQEGFPYIIMPFLEGGTLAEYINKHGPFSFAAACRYLEQLASALDYIHQHGYVHCDIKPANILLDDKGDAILSDFGIVHLSPTRDVPHQYTSFHNVIMGTPEYISPEQALGDALDRRSDIYSLGIMLFYMLTKSHPFKADSPITLALYHIHEAPPSLTARRPDTPSMIDGVIHKALAKNPEERFHTVGAFAEAFAQALVLSEQARKERKNTPFPNLHYSQSTYPKIVHDQSVGRRSKTSQQDLPSKIARMSSTFAICLILVSIIALSARYVITSLTHAPYLYMMNSSSASSVNDSLPDILTDHENWPQGTTFFYDPHQLSYHILNTSNSDVALALYNNHLFSNFHLSITMTEVHIPHQDTNYYGIVFRCANDQSHYYLFEVSTLGGGRYGFLRYDGQWTTLITNNSTRFLNPPGQNNTITIDAHNNVFTFSLNNHQVETFRHTSPERQTSPGLIGLYVENQGAEIAFSQLHINKLL